MRFSAIAPPASAAAEPRRKPAFRVTADRRKSS